MKLTPEIKSWLNQQLPLIDSLGYLSLTYEFYQKLSDYNHDLIIDLSHEKNFNPGWVAILAIMDNVHYQQFDEESLWNRLMAKAFKRQQWETMPCTLTAR